MDHFELHLSRRASFFFLICAITMLWFGLELTVLQNIFGPDDLTAHPLLIYILAGCFFGIIPLLIAWKQIAHLIHPPLLLRVDRHNVTFGIGMSYRPKQIPTKHLVAVRKGISTPDASTLRPENLLGHGGLVLSFNKDADIPKAAITSAGIKYSFGRLVVSRLYANKGLKESVETIKTFIS